MNDPKDAVFIGRFQPFHKGHLEALRVLVSGYRRITVVVGSSDQSFSFANPLTAAERLQMVREVVEREGWEKRVPYLLPFPDSPDNVMWTRCLADMIPPFDEVVTNNQLVADLFAHIRIPVKRINMRKRSEWQGVVIRTAILEKKEWQDAVPSYLIPFLKQFNFAERIRHARLSI